MFLFVIGLINVYVSWSWAGRNAIAGDLSILQAGLMVLMVQALLLPQVWLFAVYFRAQAQDRLRFEQWLKPWAYTSMGVFSFLWFLTSTRDAFAFGLSPWLNTQAWTSPSAQLGIGLTSLVLFAWGKRNAQTQLHTTEISIPLPQGESDSPLLGPKGLKIVQLSDMHLGSGPSLRQIERMVDQALKLKPDLIVLTGDILDGAPAELGPELQALAQLRARLGVYFVLGNHECYWNAEHCIAAIEAQGIQVLINRAVTFPEAPGLYLAGLSDPTHSPPQVPHLPPQHFGVLLVHQPQFAKLAAQAGYHLQLSGHTHGGQFIPWTWLVRGLYPVHRGLGRLHDLWIYVNSGTGFWGPPVRLGSSSEVTRVTLT